MGSSVLQDLLKDHISEIGDWSEIVNNHQEDSSAAESLRARQSLYNINLDGPFYIFVSQMPTHYNKEPESKGLRNDIYNLFEGPKNLLHVHLYGRGCCMLRAKNFESCVQILSKDGENFKDKPMRIEYVVPNGEHQFKYTRFTSIQLDAQMEMYQQKLLNPPEEKAKPPKPNPFGEAKPLDISKKMEEVALKVQAENTEKRPPTKPVVENPPKYFPRTIERSGGRPHLQPHPHKNDNYNRGTPRGGGRTGGGGGDHQHHPHQLYQQHHHHQGYQKPFHPRILSHKSNDGENIKGNNSSEIVSNKSNIEENKGKEVEIKSVVVERAESATLTTSTTGGSTITNITTGNTIATTSNTNGNRTRIIKSYSNTVSTAIQHHQQQQPLINEQPQLQQKQEQQIKQQQQIFINKQQEEEQILEEEGGGHVSSSINENKNVVVSNMEKKPNKKKDNKKRKSNKNQGAFNSQNRYNAFLDPEYNS
uniref:RRM domain-containing protein n=1 Tax=Meloidogyne incognita TaxID=6306 RepID=A0A914KVB9_MELIC